MSIGKANLHFSNIDVLRGFAALSVVMYHIIEIYPWPNFMAGNFIGLWFHIGWMGVDLFFVISGFVISLSMFSLYDRFRDRYKEEFMRRRFARIVPLYYLTCVVFIVFSIPAIFFEPTFWFHIFTHLTFIHNLFPKAQGSIDGANWTLGVEMQFYLLVCLLAPLLRKKSPFLILLGGVAIAWLWRVSCYWYFHHHLKLTDSSSLFFAVTQLPGMIDEFAFGIFFARIVTDDHAGHLMKKMINLRWLWVFGFFVLGYLIMHVFWKHAEYWNNWKMVVFWRSSLGLLCLSLIIVSCTLVDRWIHIISFPLRYLGTISYGIYLWHLPVILAFKTVPLGDPLRFSIYVIPVILGLSMLSWHFFEQPMQQRLRAKKLRWSSNEIKADNVATNSA